MSPAPEPSACPRCHAPRPITGAIEHARGCREAQPPASKAGYRKLSLEAKAEPPPRRDDEDARKFRAELLRLALACEAGWSDA